MLFLMNKVNFSASDRRAGLKNKHWHMSMARRKGLGVCQEVLHSGPWRLEVENSSWAENDFALRAAGPRVENPAQKGRATRRKSGQEGHNPLGTSGSIYPGCPGRNPESGLALPYTECFWSQLAAKWGNSISAYLGTW